MSAVRSLAWALALIISTASAQNTGYATYSNNAGGVCASVSTSLPVVSINAADFGGGSACGQCVQIQGTGNGAGQNPVSTAPYIAVINNVCPQCAPGDIDLQESGDGKFGITWSFTACPGSGRKLIESSRKLIVAEQRTEVVVSKVTTSEEESSVASEQQEDIAPDTVESSSEEPSQRTSQLEDIPVDSSEDVEEPQQPAEQTAPSVAQPQPSRKLLA